MDAELVINSTPAGVDIALLEDGQLVELHRDRGDVQYAVGDIYVGRVRKVMPNLNAGFVDVGHGKDAFLHHSDLGPQFQTQQIWVKRVMSGKQPTSDISQFKREADIDRKGKMKDYVSASQLVLVQVAKEPISTKGPRLTAEVSLPGRYLVLVPFSDKVSLSSRIKGDKERTRLRRLMQSIQPPGFGIIVRTVAENKGSADLHSDLSDLVDRWKKLYDNLKNGKPGKRVLGEVNKVSVVLRDVMSSDCKAIHVNDPRVADEVKEFVANIKAGDDSMVKISRAKDLFNAMSLHRQIKAAFGRQVNLRSGSYLIVEQTEAMHVIDVNSGGRKKGASSQEENALITNLDVVNEIARVLRLRDMGGIIAIDFIDMAKREHNKQLTDALRAAMKNDKAKHNIAVPSRFGVVELTRQRVRDVAQVSATDACPACNGTGKVEASILITDRIDSALKYLAEGENRKRMTLMTHPILEAYITKGWWKSIRKEWEKSLGIKLSIESNSNLEILEYHVYNALGEDVTPD